MTKEQQFLELFKKLEKYLRVEYNQGKYSYAGFMSTIYRIKKSRKNPLISHKYNFDILQQASQMRNILAHNTNVLIPTDDFLVRFKDVVDKICEPLKVRQIMIPFSKLKTAGLQDSIGDVIQLLKQYGFHAIPIIKKNRLMGIFTEKSCYDYLSMQQHKEIDKRMMIEQMIEAIDLNSNPRSYFEFIHKDASIQEAYECFTKDSKRRRELILLLVTEAGVKTQELLGIVALRDVEEALYN